MQGGYKLSHTYQRQANSNLPIVSVITVVYNAGELLQKTIDSVCHQTYKNIEYIIIDGNSTDDTLSIIKKNELCIAFWKSEPDKGLYDAMNKGLSVATGNYVIFLNAGDTFYENNTLEKIFSELKFLPDIIYGETMIVDVSGNEIGLRRLKAPEVLNWKSFRDGMVVCHQSILINRQIVEEYNLKYRVASDFDWVLRALKKANSIVNSHLIISKFLDNGLSKQNIPAALRERFLIMSKNYGFIPTLFRHFLIGIKFFWYWIKEGRF